LGQESSSAALPSSVSVDILAHLLALLALDAVADGPDKFGVHAADIVRRPFRQLRVSVGRHLDSHHTHVLRLVHCSVSTCGDVGKSGSEHWSLL
jgi:hypothetical protein